MTPIQALGFAVTHRIRTQRVRRVERLISVVLHGAFNKGHLFRGVNIRRLLLRVNRTTTSAQNHVSFPTSGRRRLTIHNQYRYRRNERVHSHDSLLFKLRATRRDPIDLVLRRVRLMRHVQVAQFHYANPRNERQPNDRHAILPKVAPPYINENEGIVPILFVNGTRARKCLRKLYIHVSQRSVHPLFADHRTRRTSGRQ